MFTTHSKELAHIKSVCEWSTHRFGGKIVLFGSSAGAPFAGSVVDDVPSIVGLVVVGYTFGWLASIVFSGHFKHVTRSTKPKCFIMGTSDEFTTVSQLERAVKKCHGDVNDVILYDGVGHFELESDAYDEDIVSKVLAWILKYDLGAE